MAQAFSQPDTEAEQQEVEEFLRRGAELSLELVDRFESREGIVLTPDEVAALPLPVSRVEVSDLVAQEEDVIASVHLDISATEGATETAVLVFVNAPDATVEGAVEDPRYVGAIGFFCHGEPAEDGGVVCELPTQQMLRYRLPATTQVTEGEDRDQLELSLLTTNVAGDPVDAPRLQVLQASLEVNRSVVRVAG